jgi:flagellin
MALTINTNISSIVAQRNLNSATTMLNAAIERMSTGYKINHASDNAAGYSISNMWTTQLGSLDIAADNAAAGADMLTTAEETYSLLTAHLQRVRDLAEQAANGTFGSQSLRSIQSEVLARLQEVKRMSANAEFNGIKLMMYDLSGTDESNAGLGITSAGVNLQVGLYSDANNVINLETKLFADASVSGLFKGMLNKTLGGEKDLSYIIGAAYSGVDTATLNDETKGMLALSLACAGLKYDATNDDFAVQNDGKATAREMLRFIDSAINQISSRVTAIGSAQNRVASAISAISVQSQNITSSLSTLRDSDIAVESSKYISAQILQQATATLLSTANQTPSIALNLL